MKSFRTLLQGVLFFTLFYNVWGQTANVTQGCVPLVVNFTPPGAHPSYYWDFEGAGTSVLSNPSPTFILPGTYTVSFRETPGGPVIGNTITITVFPDPTVSLVTQPGCAPYNASITAQITADPAISISSYTWFYGDGTFSTTSGTSTTHLYSTTDLFDISVQTATNFPTCNNTYNFIDKQEVVDKPVASYTTNPTSLSSCTNSLSNVAFTNTSTGSKTMTYNWTMGNGNTYTTTNPPNQNYTGPGTFTASLTTDFENFSGCAVTFSRQVSLGKPTVDLQQSATVACVGAPISFNTTNGGSLSWTFGAGASVANSTVASNSISYSSPGKKDIVLTVNLGGCSSTKLTSITVDQVVATATSSPDYTCSSPTVFNFNATSNQSNVTYNWTISHGHKTYTGTGPNFSRSIKSNLDSIYYSKNYTLPYFGEAISTTLVVSSNVSSCSATVLLTDTMWLPNARFVVNRSQGCAPLTVNFTDSSNSFKPPLTQWKWIWGDGNPNTVNSSNVSTNHTYTVPGIYYPRLEVRTSNGCLDTSYAIKIEVGQDLTSQLDFTATPSSICVGQSVTLAPSISLATASLIDAYHYYGESSRVSHCGTVPTVNWTFDDTVGVLPVTLQVDYNGCMTSVTKNNLITVNGASARMNYTSDCATPLVYNFTSTSVGGSGATFSWDFGDATSASGSSTSHTYARGDYDVVLTATKDGCSHSKTRRINVRNLQAAFQVPNPKEICINIPYQFNATASQDVYSNCYQGYMWEFPTIGRRRPSDRPTPLPNFSFDTSGIHQVKLVVKDVNGCVDSVKHDIKVFDMQLNATISDDFICLPSTVNFNDVSIGDTTLVTRNWAFGDGGTGIGTNVNHTYTTPNLLNPNAYTITLTVTDELGCVENRNFTINLYRPVTSISILNPTTLIKDTMLCVGDNAFITAPDFTLGGYNLSYAWNFNNGNTSTTQNNTQQFNLDQFYTINLTFTEDSTGCTGSTSASLNVQDYPVAYITSNPLGPEVCGVQVVLMDSSQSIHPLSHTWDFGNGQTSTNSSFGPSYVDGTFTIKHSVSTSNGCSDDAPDKTLRINNPLGTFQVNKTVICKGDSVLFALNNDTSDVASFQWSFGDGTFIDNKDSVYHIYAFNPNNNVFPAALILRASQPPGCTFEKVRNINVHRVVASFDRLTEASNNDTTMCMNELPYTFTNTSEGVASGADDFQWTLGDGQFSTLYSPSHQYQVADTFAVKLFTRNRFLGCQDSITKEIILFQNPIVRVRTDTACLGNGVNLTVTNVHPGSTYAWSPGTGLNFNNIPNPVATITSPATYTVVETDANGCTDDTTVNAIVITPLALADYDTTIIVGDIVTLPASKPDYYHFAWNPSDGLSCQDCNNPITQPLENIVYTLTVTDELNCFTDNYTFDITVRPETFIKFPTLFTPNGDGANDVIYVKGWGIKELLEFKIFNRWGQLIYESTDLEEGWDGRFKGEIQNTDVYAFKVKVSTWRNTEIVEEGYFNLVR
ncbi:MAG: PKD domain-containing protein [Cytophagaceae bacterium]|nr:PKD domain-containing protein [Cytophagaceae bacterium]